MASAAITITNVPATIESTTSQARITKDPALPGLSGVLVNGGTKTTWVAINQANAATAVATNDAQAQGTVGMIAGASIPIAKSYQTIDHLCGGSDTTTLYWFPDAL